MVFDNQKIELTFDIDMNESTLISDNISSVSLTPNGSGNYKAALFLCKGVNDYSAIDDVTVSE